MPALAAAAFVAGACLLQTLAALPSAAGAWMLLLPLAAAGNRRWRAAGLLVLMFGGGFYYAAWRAEMRLAERLPQELIWQDVWAEGTIRGFAETTWRRSRFVFDIEKIGDPPRPL